MDIIFRICQCTYLMEITSKILDIKYHECENCKRKWVLDHDYGVHIIREGLKDEFVK